MTDRAPLPTDPSTLPALPASFHQTLSAGLADLGLELDRRQLDQLDGFSRLLIAWTAAINLTAIREPEAIAREHLLDSLSAVPLLRRGDAASSTLLDIGSGGGLPGIPLAVALPEVRVRLVESITKKARFLSTAVDAIGLGSQVEVANVRAESLAGPDGGPRRGPRGGTRHQAAPDGRWDIVTVRAVASLPRLIILAMPLLAPGGRLIAWKRGDLDAELGEGARTLDAHGGGTIDAEPIAVPALGDHRLVVVRPAPSKGHNDRLR